MPPAEYLNAGAQKLLQEQGALGGEGGGGGAAQKRLEEPGAVGGGQLGKVGGEQLSKVRVVCGVCVGGKNCCERFDVVRCGDFVPCGTSASSTPHQPTLLAGSPPPGTLSSHHAGRFPSPLQAPHQPTV